MNERDPAQARFVVINLLRMAGVAMVFVGMLIAAEVIALPAILGYVLIAVGVVDALFMPLVLARRWRTPKP